MTKFDVTWTWPDKTSSVYNIIIFLAVFQMAILINYQCQTSVDGNYLKSCFIRGWWRQRIRRNLLVLFFTNWAWSLSFGQPINHSKHWKAQSHVITVYPWYHIVFCWEGGGNPRQFATPWYNYGISSFATPKWRRYLKILETQCNYYL